ncbi:hypothetical protein Q8F57_045535 [Paraburkholderia terrae]|uniref:hypothetical protein n=1 Tax=Paraburkholderia terrae TaxID=311230 RepID=UPI00296B1026|nr:hypothetical protein [Paraburkholderia terrae]MDW3660648.1 hypothetical protein [Paraburkholderia terrae]
MTPAVVEWTTEAFTAVTMLVCVFCAGVHTGASSRNPLAFTSAVLAGALVTSAALEYLLMHASRERCAPWVFFGAALLIQIVGAAWLRPSILTSTRIQVPPSLLASWSLPGRPAAASTGTGQVRPLGTWLVRGCFAGLLTTAFLCMSSMPVGMTRASSFLLLVSQAIALACSCLPRRLRRRLRRRGIDRTLRLVAGLLLTAFGTFRVGNALGVVWRPQAAAILALLAAWILLSGWLIATARGGESKWPLNASSIAPRQASIVRLHSRPTVNARILTIAVETVIWTIIVATWLHVIETRSADTNEWRAGVLLFAGYAGALVHSVLLDIRLPADG